jgi:ECF sigma factor
MGPARSVFRRGGADGCGASWWTLRVHGAHTSVGGSALKVNLDETALLSSAPKRSILALDEALTAFSQIAPRQAKVVEFHYFGALTEEEIAALRISPRTVRGDWISPKLSYCGS